MKEICRICREHNAVIGQFVYNPAQMCAGCRRALRKVQKTNPFGRMSCWPGHYTANTDCVKRFCIANHISVDIKIDPDDNPDVLDT
jgi:hypothetical protein